MRDISLL